MTEYSINPDSDPFKISMDLIEFILNQIERGFVELLDRCSLSFPFVIQNIGSGLPDVLLP